MVKVTIIGAGSPVCKALLYGLSTGEVLGRDSSLNLVLYDDLVSWEKLQPLKEEILNAAFDVVEDVAETSDLDEALLNADIAILLNSAPRSVFTGDSTMAMNFITTLKNIGEAINRTAKKDVLVVVAGCPGLLNAWVCSQFAPSVKRQNFTVVTMMDLNLAVSHVAAKLQVATNNVHNMTVWGNSSMTLVPDADNAYIQMSNYTSTRIKDDLGDDHWLKDTFVSEVQKNWATGQDPSEEWPLATAQACCQHLRCLWQCVPTEDNWTCLGVASDGSYDVPNGIFSSFPVSVPKRNRWAIVKDVPISMFVKLKLRDSVEEMKQEQKIIYDICKPSENLKISSLNI
ncbi:malate dehydrogenase, cytoplasmic-like [Bacillus rossius redtenbacheri]|uniref:malate dehydrogenase, cytoplasmic-like n=1 Tax=Bacillus rossius redtenbacheri TaxID=93214 RepID=UPI002FDD787A